MAMEQTMDTIYPESVINPEMENPDNLVTSVSVGGDQTALIDQFESALAMMNAVHGMANIAESLSDTKLAEIGARVYDDYQIDRKSRKDWEDKNKRMFKLAKLVAERKQWAGRDIHSIKYPLIAGAALQFNSRSLPELIKDGRAVKAKVLGFDPDGLKAARGERVATHMSVQLQEFVPGWEEGMDYLLIYAPIVGSGFKKTYQCEVNDTVMSEFVMAENLVVDYWAPDIEKARRVTEIVQISQNEIIERMRSGRYIEFDIKDLGSTSPEEDDHIQGEDEDAPQVLLEQHRYLDLDDDGYAEPYIVLIHRDTQKVLRISARFDIDTVSFDDDGRVVRIPPVHYYTRYLFIPDPEGGFYGMGFGSLLWPLNEAINAIIDQLLDAGMNANRGGGFLGGDLQLGRNRGQHGNIQVAPGEWVPVKSRGIDIKQNIVPLPLAEPSMVLFQLLGFLVDAGKELAAQVDILSGQSPGTHVPAQSTLALIEQGLKVYGAIMKRVHRGLKAEYAKIRRLNWLYLPDEDYRIALDGGEAAGKADYRSGDLDIVPVSDPNAATDISRMMKSQALMGMLNMGLNDFAIKRRALEAMDIENVNELLPPESQQMSPAEELEMALKQAELQKIQADIALVQAKIQTEGGKAQNAGVKAAFDAEKLKMEKARIMNEAVGKQEEVRIRKAEIMMKGSQAAEKAAEPAKVGTDVPKPKEE